MCAFANGKKLPALVIFKEKGGELGKRVRSAIQCPENIKVTGTTNGWMTKDKLLWWVQHMWNESEDGERRLLILDHYKPHRSADTQSLASSLDTDLSYIPAGCTSIAQPMDVSINAPFKMKITIIIYKVVLY